MNNPIWLREERPCFLPLNRNLKVDTVVIGAGITGATAAYLLKQAGQKVVLLDKGRWGTGDTGHTTAHLTYVTDLRLSQLVDNFSADCAAAVWRAQEMAIEHIENNVQTQGIDCNFKRVPGYLHTSWDSVEDSNEGPSLAEEAQLAMEMGFRATYLQCVPFADRPGIRFEQQAKFHPIKYIRGLLDHVDGDGSHVFEHTALEKVADDGLLVEANGHRIECQYLVMATHAPLSGHAGFAKATVLQSKLAPYTSYVVGARLPHIIIPEALFWDTSDPYYYLRIEARDDHDYAIFGGEDHKTGQDDNNEERFERLEEKLRSIIPQVQVTDRWSGQVWETNDGLPYIGQITPCQFVATGFAGNGMTFGTLSGMLACDAALKKPNVLLSFFDPGRTKVRGGTLDYIRENVDYPYYMVKDRLTSPADGSLEGLAPGEGKILNVEGERVAAYRDQQGQLILLSPVCTHMGCIVHWNKAEQTWDCPCHGSRFQPTGEVLSGPAESPLPHKEPVKSGHS